MEKAPKNKILIKINDSLTTTTKKKKNNAMYKNTIFFETISLNYNLQLFLITNFVLITNLSDNFKNSSRFVTEDSHLFNNVLRGGGDKVKH